MRHKALILTIAAEATAAVTLAAATAFACQPERVIPAQPAVTPATCESGEVLVMPADSSGITYTETGALTGPGSVVITATARGGFVLAPADGWQVAENAVSATFTVSLAGPLTGCTEDAGAPVTPAIAQATCTSGEVLAMPEDTDDIVYTETGALVGPSRVVITATAQPGYALEAAGGWQMAEGSHQATFTVRLAGRLTVGCGTTTHHPHHSPPPVTGSPLPATAFTL
jgi:hypothetical protein